MLCPQVKALIALGFTGAAFAAPHSRRAYGAAPSYAPNADRANAVKEAFSFAWKGYYENAFPHDTLRPVSNTWLDDRNSWGASAVDAFSTAIIMNQQEIVDQILEYVPTIDFDHSDSEISLFETTIRYLGGLVSSYDLLTGPESHLVKDQDQVEKVLAQAKRLADNLKIAFDTPSGVPDNSVFLKDEPARGGSSTNGAATIGTLILEWQRLSDLTGNAEYGQLAKKGNSYLINPSPQYNEPWPGLIGSNFDIGSGEMLDAHGAWTGGTDSFYEYLIKMYLYNKNDFSDYLERWKLAASSSIKYLASHPSSNTDITFLADYNNKTLSFESQHLACFDGGNFILGGLTLGDQSLVDFGLGLTAGCRQTYAKTGTKIGPDAFGWKDSVLNTPEPPSDQKDFYDENGFWLTGPSYQLRPEVIESYYYAYRATGDTKYQDWAWEAFVAINGTCRTGSGFSNLNNVQDADSGFGDDQESFFFAEVMKYSYMIHAEDADWQVKADQTNKFVFNTEAHPVRIANEGTAKRDTKMVIRREEM